METVVVSDMHLSEAQPVERRRPLWMAYKRREFFVDDDFVRLLEYVERHADGPVELVLNGDIFDFDSVIQVPRKGAGHVDWLARLRGLASEEWMSLFKIDCIIKDHPHFFASLGAFVRRGNRAVFVVGNHDVELYWPSVQRRIREALGLPPRSVPPLPSPEQWVAYAGVVPQDSDPGEIYRNPEQGSLESPGPAQPGSHVERRGEAADATDNPRHHNPGHANPGHANPGHANPGHDNPGHRHADEDAQGAESFPPESLSRADPVAFCSWFYLSEGDTFISHGSQYDRNCVTKSPINPLISVRGKPYVRIPFGDIAGRYLLNGMGYFNPHATENYIMSATQYLRFFFRYMLRTQPLLIWTWFWGAMVTFFIGLWSHLRPAMRDPLLVDEKVQAIAWRSQATPSMVRKLNALSVPSASSNPLAILRELWLDRALLFLLVLYAAWQIVLNINIAMPISPLWVLVPLVLFLPPYFAYAASIRPTVFKQPLLTPERAEFIAKITGAKRVVFGHTHKPEQCEIGPVTYYNGGFWSPAFAEPECQHRIGTQTFVWIRPADSGQRRHAGLYEWPPGGTEPRPHTPATGDGQACGRKEHADDEATDDEYGDSGGG